MVSSLLERQTPKGRTTQAIQGEEEVKKTKQSAKLHNRMKTRPNRKAKGVVTALHDEVKAQQYHRGWNAGYLAGMEKDEVFIASLRNCSNVKLVRERIGEHMAEMISARMKVDA
jgi:hypothetical protein